MCKKLNDNRIKSYGSDCKVHIKKDVSNVIECENKLKKAFCSKFKIVQGKETFRGDINEMIKVFKEVTRK
jgi:hypothetical protein